MKRLLLILLLLLPTLSKANHVSGVDLYYTHISGNTYKVSMTVYGNCGQDNYKNLYKATPRIQLIDSAQGTNNIISTFTLELNPDTVEISPYCNAQKNNTTCSTPMGLLPGYKRFIFSDTITLPYKSKRWIFRFTTSNEAGTSCGSYFGRPTDVVNLDANTGKTQAIGLEAMIDNTTADNNSTLFDNTVFTAYCINAPSIYTQGTSESDGDSLVFASVTPVTTADSKDGNSPDTRKCNIPSIQCVYFPGFSVRNPIAVVPGSYSFDTTTGNVSFTATQVGTFAVATRVYEYRNGKLVGYVTREKEFKILSGCNNPAPSGNIDSSAISLSGGNLFKQNNIIMCPGQTLTFKIPLTDANGDTIKASILSLPPGSTASISANNTKTPVINFSWNTTGTPTGFYTFTCFYTDNGCPFASSNQVTYHIEIADVSVIDAIPVEPTNCIHQALVKYTYTNYFGRPYTINVYQGTNLIRSYRDSTGIIYDSMVPGNYSVKFFNDLVPCMGNGTLNFNDYGTYPYAPTVDTNLIYCLHAFAVPLTAKPTGTSVTTLQWYDESHHALSTTTPLPVTNTPGIAKYYVTEKYKTCESNPDSLYVTTTGTECDYDIHIFNALTPNGDGKNDVWYIGNLDTYPNALVQVFDKLGDKVFDQKGYQNNWMGGDLPSGVYYYLINLNERNKATGLQTYTGYLMLQR